MRILHLFQWKLTDIMDNIEKISNQGFNAIQISPMQPLKELNNCNWWIHYQPIAFEIGNALIGTKDELIELCTKAKKYNIRIIADVVLNHMADNNEGTLKPNDKISKTLTDNPYFWKVKKHIWNWYDRHEVINYSVGLPTLNLANYDLQDIVIDFLNELISCGVSGFRFDSAKNISLPSEGNNFWIRVLENLNRKDLFNYAEVIYSPKELIDQYCQYINVITDSFGSNKDKLVTFVESHDTFLEFKCTNKIDDKLMIREYDLLTDNYKNTLFYSRPFSRLWEDDRIRTINEKVREC